MPSVAEYSPGLSHLYPLLADISHPQPGSGKGPLGCVHSRNSPELLRFAQPLDSDCTTGDSCPLELHRQRHHTQHLHSKSLGLHTTSGGYGVHALCWINQRDMHAGEHSDSGSCIYLKSASGWLTSSVFNILLHKYLDHPVFPSQTGS